MNSAFRSIIITGAGSGIGSVLAEHLAGPGVYMGLIGRDLSRLENTAGKCRKAGTGVEIASIDVRDQGMLRQWLTDFDDKHAIDLVIANAGITFIMTGEMLHETQEQLINVMDTNFNGVINTIFPVIERMQLRNHGHVAVLSSLAALYGMPGFPTYSASKAALLNYFQGIRGRLAVNGIGLSIICPGYVQTPMTDKLPGMKLMLMPVEKAARIINRGLERRKPLIIFPTLLRIGLWLLNVLPVGLSTRILNRLSGIRKREE